MSQDTDIQNLFRQFNGQPTQYKEIARAEASEGARHRWPLLDAIRLQQDPVPPAKISDTIIDAVSRNTAGLSTLTDSPDDLNTPETQPQSLPQTQTQPAVQILSENLSPAVSAPSEPSNTSWFRAAAYDARPQPSEVARPVAATTSTSSSARLFSARPQAPVQHEKPAPATIPAAVPVSAPTRVFMGRPGPLPETRPPVAPSQPEATPLKSLFSRIASTSDTGNSPSPGFTLRRR